MTDGITLERPDPAAAVPAADRLRFVDCDIHPTFKTSKALHPFLSQHWRDHLDAFGALTHGIYATRGNYPRFTPETARRDAWPPNGNPPGSDLAFMQQQHLDAHDIRYGILEPLVGANNLRNLELSTAMCAAVNLWQVEEFTSRDSRLKATVHICAEDAAGAVDEIGRWADDRQFAGIQLGSRSLEPIGRTRYWPIFEAAEALGLPVAFHVGGPSSAAPAPGGWPSYYMEEHHVLIHTGQAQVASMILEGVFERFPALKVIIIECGYAWAPSLAWRLDAHWKKMRLETPHCPLPPSHYMKRNIWFTTQPAEEPEHPRDLRLLFEWIGFDRMMFSTDYPHWDYDDPARALPIQMSPAERRMLFHDTAMSVFKHLE